ncbi:MAG: hypothetical protein GXO64_01110 [Candidatus Micrarchaeota archaeon]|nr:hypothetical protein [Candidatus Micrarchaeota archaeon]
MLTAIFCAQAANELEISGSSQKMIEFGESATFNFTIKNNMNRMTDIVILVKGGNLGWVTLDKYFFFLPQLSEKDVNLNVYPQDNGTHSYTLIAQSASFPDIHASVDVIVDAVGNKKEILKKEENVIGIVSLSAKVQSGQIIVNSKISKTGNETANVDVYLKDRNGKIISTITKTIEGSGNHDIFASFPATDILAGRYDIELLVRKFMISKRTSVVIPVIEDIRKEKKITHGLFFETITISVENDGNVIEDDYTLNAHVPAMHYVTWSVPPVSQYISEDMITSSWTFGSLRPKDKIIVSYTIHYWYFMLKLIIAVLIVIAAIGIVYMKLSKPSISKKYVKKGHNTYLVILEVKGSFFTRLRNVLVKDALSPLTKLDGKIEGVAPVIRKDHDKTELLWRVGTLKRGDERIFSYSIKPVVEAHIKLPRAMMRYKKTEEGEKLRVYSAEIELE